MEKSFKVNKELKSEIQQLKDMDHSVGKYLRPYLLILRCFGAHPFSTDRTAENDPRYYRKWISLSSLYSIVFTGIGMVYLFKWFSDYFTLVLLSENRIWLKQFGFQNSSSTEGLTMIIFSMVNPSLIAFILLSALTQINTLIEIINRWSGFEKEYRVAFPFSQMPFKGLRWVRNRGFVLGPMILLSTLAVGGRLNTINCNFVKETNPDTREKYENLCSVTTNYVSVAVILGFLEDFKQIMLLEACRMAFEQMRTSTKEQHLSTLKTSFFISKKKAPENVRKWLSLLLFIREQVRLTGRVMSLHHLLNILVLFTTFCLSIFMEITILLTAGEENSRVRETSTGTLSLCLVGSLRLISKAFIAEKIMKQEKMFANDVRDMKESGSGEDLMTRLEMSILIDLIDRKPSGINFGGVMILNYSLLLDIVGQVATYLIVLVQFNNLEKPVNLNQ